MHIDIPFTSRELSITIPGPPVGAARPRVTRNGTFIPKHVKFQERWIATKASDYWHFENREPMRGIVEVSVVQVQKRPQRLMRKKDPQSRMLCGRGKPDLDNVVKLVLDGLVKGGVIHDDTQVGRIIADKWYAAIDEEPCTEIRVKEVTIGT